MLVRVDITIATIVEHTHVGVSAIHAAETLLRDQVTYPAVKNYTVRRVEESSRGLSESTRVLLAARAAIADEDQTRLDAIWHCWDTTGKAPR